MSKSFNNKSSGSEINSKNKVNIYKVTKDKVKGNEVIKNDFEIFSNIVNGSL